MSLRTIFTIGHTLSSLLMEHFPKALHSTRKQAKSTAFLPKQASSISRLLLILLTKTTQLSTSPTLVRNLNLKSSKTQTRTFITQQMMNIQLKLLSVQKLTRVSTTITSLLTERIKLSLQTTSSANLSTFGLTVKSLPRVQITPSARAVRSSRSRARL